MEKNTENEMEIWVMQEFIGVRGFPNLGVLFGRGGRGSSKKKKEYSMWWWCLFGCSSLIVLVVGV